LVKESNLLVLQIQFEIKTFGVPSDLAKGWSKELYLISCNAGLIHRKVLKNNMSAEHSNIDHFLLYFFIMLTNVQGDGNNGNIDNRDIRYTLEYGKVIFDKEEQYNIISEFITGLYKAWQELESTNLELYIIH